MRGGEASKGTKEKEEGKKGCREAGRQQGRVGGGAGKEGEGGRDRGEKRKNEKVLDR